MVDVNVPTQEDPGVPACALEVKEALQPTNIGDWSSKVEQDVPLDAGLEEQFIGQVDPCLPSQSDEPIPLGQGCSRQKFKQWSFLFEPNDQRVKEFVQEAHHRPSHQDTSDAISGHSSKPQEVSNCRFGFVGERMLWDWYQPE